TGVFQTFDLGGLDTIHAICGVLFPSLSNQAVPGATFDRLIEDGRLGARTGAGWYDYTPEVLEGVRNALWDALLQQAIQSAPAGAH
ncbi:MAG: hypothetical protein FJX77_09910, partial [Armatimonadetes bacterium]|nr:hypothetical protein [Armatimonadota bacterium]